MSSNSIAILWTTLCNNSGTKLIGTWLSSSNVQVRILTRFYVYIHSLFQVIPWISSILLMQRALD
jgi:hypothetical protein